MSGQLAWRRDGDGWILLASRRRFGRVVPDAKHPGMYRSILSRGRLSGMASLSHSKNAVLLAAERELDWEAGHRPAISPSKCPEKGGVFRGTSSPVRFSRPPGTDVAASPKNRLKGEAA